MKKENWDDLATNAEQNYLTHGLFRYFGKLPPTLTARILNEVGVKPGMVVADVMCGSGTTLIEAINIGASAIGVDCNDLSVLISKVKTTPVINNCIQALKTQLRQQFKTVSFDSPILNGHKFALQTDRSDAPKIRNIDHWFDQRTIDILLCLRSWIEGLPSGSEQDIAKVAFAATIRPASKASVRTGRLFVDVDKKLPNPLIEFERRLDRMQDAVASLAGSTSWHNPKCKLVIGDARATGLEAQCADVVFCHPPYFALYRYSSDPLRFELEWLRLNRKAIIAREVEDGFKTTDETLVRNHVEDLGNVIAEGHRIAKPRGRLVVVTADSTLRKQRLDILDPLIAEAVKVGWKLERRIVRKVRYAQASYHKSFDAEIQRPDDEIMIFQRT
jgi:site-specific DNA-methyltransferase (cytosine-N4-specific)